MSARISGRPISLLIAALGGEGGGVLAEWIVNAARQEGLLVQSTSIPGVAQRTGATNYYIELATVASMAGAPPFALTPMAGKVDVVIASELVEAGRVLQAGYVDPVNTTLIASTHRVYTTSEKSHMADGRVDTKGILKAARTLARRAILFDMEVSTREAGSVISAVMLGALAGAGVLPIKRETFEGVIRAAGIAVDSNLRGFELAYRLANGQVAQSARPSRLRAKTASGSEPLDRVLAEARQTFPTEAIDIIELGVRRLMDYQNASYARRYLSRLRPIAKLELGYSTSNGNRLLRETARRLAVRMAFDDILRVADLKTRKARFEKVRKEVSAQPNQPVTIVEYFKPGIEELSGFLPPALGKKLLSWADRRKLTHSLNVGVHLHTSSISGFLLLWSVARLRFIRPHGYRFAEEQGTIEAWLSAIEHAARISYEFGLEVAECARIIKGYSGTFRSSLQNFTAILDDIVNPAIAAGRDASAETRVAREAALDANRAQHAQMGNVPTKASEYKPIVITPLKRKPSHESAASE
jgi:indolepyruvate ferredoxin oxidoreductase beta subunit